MPKPQPAATVLLLRDDADGPRVFMVQRARAVGFMPNAWVFPGGRVDAGDKLHAHPRVTGGERAAKAMGLTRDNAVPYLVAAAREVFEEAGLWLGEGEVRAEFRGPLANRSMEMVGVLHMHEATVDLDRFHAWSWWVTPEIEARRFDTRFFVTRVRHGQEASHDTRETVASEWVTASEALARAEAGEMLMAPPTWWTLREIAPYRSVDEVLEASARRPQRPIMPVAKTAPSGELELLLPGHPDHKEPEIQGLGLPISVKLVQGRWWANGKDSVRA